MLATGLSGALRWLQRVVKVSLSEVSYSNNLSSYTTPEEYNHKIIDAAALRDASNAAAEDVNEPGGAFARGDKCVATFNGNKLVGYNFYSDVPTPLDDNTEFFFPSGYQYSYAAYTAPAHRGIGLSPSRWTFYRDWRSARGLGQRTISYIDMTNLSSLASGTTDDRVVLGYAARLTHRGRRFYWSSPGCRRASAGFRRIR